MPTESTRILVADDHLPTLEGLVRLLTIQPDFEVVGKAHHGREVIELARALRPSVIIMDLLMPELDGVQATEAIMSELPDTKVLVLTDETEADRIEAALSSGALAYVAKQASLRELPRIIRSLKKGRPTIRLSRNLSF